MAPVLLRSPRSIERGSIEALVAVPYIFDSEYSPRSIERGSIEAIVATVAPSAKAALHVRLNVAPLKRVPHQQHKEPERLLSTFD